MVEIGSQVRENARWTWAVDAVDSEQSVEDVADEVRRLWADTEANRVYIDGLMGGFESVRRQRLCAVRLLGKALESMGIDPRGESLGREATGKPILVCHEKIDISLSHSGHYVACAVLVGDGRIGVDVEEYAGWTDERACRAMERFFGEKERKQAETAKDFIKLWTLREAVCKLDGGGNPLRVDTAGLPEDIWHDTRPIEGGQLTVAATCSL